MQYDHSSIEHMSNNRTVSPTFENTDLNRALKSYVALLNEAVRAEADL